MYHHVANRIIFLVCTFCFSYSLPLLNSLMPARKAHTHTLYAHTTTNYTHIVRVYTVRAPVGTDALLHRMLSSRDVGLSVVGSVSRC